jgi:predicted PurR-regulated permease PerM
MKEKHRTIVLGIILLLLFYVTYRILSPILTYVILGLLLAFIIFPVYAQLRKWISSTAAALLCIAAVFFVIIIPSIWLTAQLIDQATNAYQAAQAQGITFASVAQYLPGVSAEQLQAAVAEALHPSKIAAIIPRIVSLTGEILFGMLILVVVLFYALKEGDSWYEHLFRLLPTSDKHKKRLHGEITQMTKALFYGQILTSVIIGALSGTVFAAFGIPNPILWGFIMGIFSFLPVLGAPVIYLPAGIILMVDGRLFAGISIIVLCTAAMFLAEYVIRPKFVSRTAELHPLTVIIGAAGGVFAFGFVGFLIGPLIIGVLIRVLSFDID